MLTVLLLLLCTTATLIAIVVMTCSLPHSQEISLFGTVVCLGEFSLMPRCPLKVLHTLDNL